MRTASHLASLGLALVLITGVAERIRRQTVDPAQTFAALEDKILSKGPNGEKPSLASSVSLTAEDLEKIRC
jgi:ribose transport system substrate-binding protein